MSELLRPKLPVKPRNVLVLMGGWSAEREVSLSSGQGVMRALKALGHSAESFDPPRDVLALAQGIQASFNHQGPDIIFNILHGHEVEDGILQGVLNLMGIPYTFSGVLGSSLAMNKGVARDIVGSCGVRCPEGEVLSVSQYKTTPWTFFPHVMKPLTEGSTVGVQMVSSFAEQVSLADAWTYGDQVLVERYIPGREIQVAVFGGVATGALEITFKGPIFSYEAKYTEGKAQHLCPAPVPPEVYQDVLKMAETAYRALRCSGVVRSDFRYDDTVKDPGVLYFLETNTQPGMTSLSIVPDIMKTQGWSYEDVVQWIIEDASCPKP
jgi:D-alanine-D-alanine ligase